MNEFFRTLIYVLCSIALITCFGISIVIKLVKCILELIPVAMFLLMVSVILFREPRSCDEILEEHRGLALILDEDRFYVDQCLKESMVETQQRARAASLHELTDVVTLELREAEEAREAHVRRLANFEQRFEQLDQALRAEQAAIEQELADAELRLSEAHGRLAALQDAANAHLALGIDPNIQQWFNKMVKQQELRVQQLEAMVRLVGQQKEAADRQVATLSGSCEDMRRQIENLRQSGASASANNRTIN